MPLQGKARNALTAIFNTANLNGIGATMMSFDVGTSFGTYLYVAAVLAGTVNKYLGLRGGDGGRKNALLNAVTHPAITAATFMGAAGYNLYGAAHDYLSLSSGHDTGSLLLVGAWTAALLGDNALRRLDSVNFKQSAKELGSSIKSKLSKTFNALVANPTIFYGLTSTFMVMSGLVSRVDEAGKSVPLYSGVEGMLGVGTGVLVAAGITYALCRTGLAVQGKITNDQINDGNMNKMAFIGKLGYGLAALANHEYGLGAGHLMFAWSSLKVVRETQAALEKKMEPN